MALPSCAYTRASRRWARAGRTSLAGCCAAWAATVTCMFVGCLLQPWGCRRCSVPCAPAACCTIACGALCTCFRSFGMLAAWQAMEHSDPNLASAACSPKVAAAAAGAAALPPLRHQVGGTCCSGALFQSGSQGRCNIRQHETQSVDLHDVHVSRAIRGLAFGPTSSLHFGRQPRGLLGAM